MQNALAFLSPDLRKDRVLFYCYKLLLGMIWTLYFGPLIALIEHILFRGD
jgi:hypothetical protein